MRRSHYLVLILLLIAQTTFGQVYQNMAQPGYKFGRARFDSVLTIPSGLGNLKNISGGQDTGQIRFNKSDSSVYVWNGRAWIKPVGGGADTTKIPLAGTAVGKPITGDLEIDNLAGNKRIKGNASSSYIEFTDDGGININETTGSNVNVMGVTFNGQNLVGSDGIKGIKNYSANYNSLNFIQKVYSDSVTNLKLNISDTATMLAPYSRVTVSSYGKNAGGDSTILLLSNGTRYAAKDSVGSGGGASGWSLTGNASAVTDFLGTTNNRTMRFRTNNVERMVIDSVGLVGIGTNAPASKLSITVDQPNDGITVKTTRNESITLVNVQNNNGVGGSFRAYGPSIGVTDVRNQTALFSDNGLLFFTGGGAEKMRIVSNGNVSINSNTDTATDKLFVNGSFRATTAQAATVFGSTASGGTLTLSSTSNATKGKILFGTSAYDQVNNRLGIGTASPSNLIDVSGSGGPGTIKAQVENTSTAGDARFTVKNNGTGTITLQSTGSAYAGVPSLYNIGTLLMEGNLTKFNITTNGDVSTGGTSPINFVAGGFSNNPTMTITAGNTGSVGIGVNTPAASAKLDITSTTQGILIPRMTLTQRNAIASPAAGLQVIVTGETGGEFLSFYNSSTVAWQRVVKLTSAGRLLLGTTTESTHILDVVGTQRITGQILSTVSGNSALKIQSNSWFELSANDIISATGSSLIGGSTPGMGIRYGAGVTFGTGARGYHYLTDNYALFSSQTSAVNLSSGVPASAVLEARSTTQGFLPPRMTTAQKIAIASPTAGLVVYDTTLNKLCVYTTAWETITSL